MCRLTESLDHFSLTMFFLWIDVQMSVKPGKAKKKTKNKKTAQPGIKPATSESLCSDSQSFLVFFFFFKPTFTDLAGQTMNAEFLGVFHIRLLFKHDALSTGPFHGLLVDCQP